MQPKNSTALWHNSYGELLSEHRFVRCGLSTIEYFLSSNELDDPDEYHSFSVIIIIFSPRLLLFAEELYIKMPVVILAFRVLYQCILFFSWIMKVQSSMVLPGTKCIVTFNDFEKYNEYTFPRKKKLAKVSLKTNKTIYP